MDFLSIDNPLARYSPVNHNSPSMAHNSFTHNEEDQGKGSGYPGSPSYVRILQLMSGENDNSDFRLRLASCEDELSRIRLFKEEGPSILEVTDEDDNLDVFRKNGDYSLKLRETANRAYKTKKYSEALHGYNLAIVYAPNSIGEDGIPNLALAIGNRSAVLQHMGRFQDAIRDIDLALKHGYPASVVHKLESERKLCVDKLRDLNLGGNVERDANAVTTAVKTYKEETLFNIQSPNPLLPAALDCVDIQLHPTKGRQLFVTKDLPAGTVLVVEEPFAKNLQRELEWDLKRCHYCCKKILVGIPCPSCVFAIYCDDACLNSAATEYHSSECLALPFIHMNLPSSVYLRMTFRIICKAGAQKLFKIHETKDPEYFNPKIQSQGTAKKCIGCDPVTGIYDSNSYLSVYHIASQSQYLSPAEKFKNTLNGIILSEVLEVFTDFYADIEPNELSGFKDFIASACIHHLESLPCNAISLGEIGTNTNTGNQATIKPIEFGGGVYPVCGLINHSCFPNVTRVLNKAKGQMSILSTLDLKSGDALMTTYGRAFYHQDLSDRQKYLKTYFNFECDCAACQGDWGLLEDIVGKSKFCCSSSKCPSTPDNNQVEASHPNQYILGSSSSRNESCIYCGKSFNLSKLEEERDFHTKSYHEAKKLILNNLPLQAIQLLRPCLRFFNREMSCPNLTTVLAQDLLKQAIDLVVAS